MFQQIEQLSFHKISSNQQEQKISCWLTYGSEKTYWCECECSGAGEAGREPAAVSTELLGSSALTIIFWMFQYSYCFLRLLRKFRMTDLFPKSKNPFSYTDWGIICIDLSCMFPWCVVKFEYFETLKILIFLQENTLFGWKYINYAQVAK